MAETQDKIKAIQVDEQGTKLGKAVAEIINDHINEDETYTLADYLQDLFTGGCQSGFVTELIYYTDTEKFYAEYREDISAALVVMLEETGFSVWELFGDKWDRYDPLANDTQNKNLLAWFAFEETARNIGQGLGIEL